MELSRGNITDLKVVSLFSGCGGLDLGFSQAGFKIIWANDCDKDVWTTYQKNHFNTHLDKRDLRDIPSTDIPDCIGIIGGPPCQSWSEAGTQKGINDQRGLLFLEYIRVLKDKQPLFFLAENVSGMLHKKHTQALARIIDAFEEANYTVSYKLLNALNYHVPQERKRVIFVGFRSDLHKQYGLHKLRNQVPHTTPFDFDSLEITYPFLTLQETIEELAKTALPAVDKNQTNGDACLVANHEYMQGGFSSIYMSRNRVRSWHEPSFTIQASGRHAPLHPQANKMIHVGKDQHIFDPESPHPYRRLSVRECARIQTFPDNFIFHYQNLNAGYKMIGNAVPVNFSYALAKAIKANLFTAKQEVKEAIKAKKTRQLSFNLSTQSQNCESMTNILQAINTVITNQVPDIVDFYRSENKINAAGDALELFVKDIFADTLTETREDQKADIYQRVFSYFGNANNPPDFMITNGDAVEVKKLQTETAQIALNSSYPSAKLFADSPMITKACRECEDWTEKDLLYAIGCVKKQKLSLLWLVYGDCYAASRETYEGMKNKIAAGIEQTAGVEFSPTKELGRVNKVDPLGITNFRIRGMWQIEHPQKVYQYLDFYDQKEKSLRLFVLMRESKYLSFPAVDREKIEQSATAGFQIKNVKIKLPDNPVKRIPAKLISYQI